ncbi:signal peptidase complex subunit 1 isoform X2 [Thrips palmi]|uniref:Signal peptidase complex subunit 1 n=1 Tax=Thrips palmi TaxID=161013 RepID=A0A6P8YTC4_THRPL|nr:signal peptidase complex subunit 1 isoform X2 [Thrips palmi]
MDFFSNIPTHMDYDGQGRSEKISRLIITLFGVVGLVWGYIIQQFSETVYVLFAGFFLAACLTVPPWPMYRRKPLPWQKPRPAPREEGSETQSPKTKKKK